MAVDVIATVREGVTLLVGPRAHRAADMTAAAGDRPRYSQAGRGWVIPTSQLADVEAYCQAHYWLLVVRDRRRRAS